MRLTGGRLGRRHIAVPKAADRGAVRPTSDRVREALFSALASRCTLEGAVVLDVFAGSGALGLEAVSRGASHSTFIERDRATARTLRENAKGLGVTAETTVLELDALKGLAKVTGPFDVVFADPPYALALDGDWMNALGRHLRPSGLLVVERDKRSAPLPPPAEQTLVFDRAWGQSRIFIFGRPSPPGAEPSDA